MTDPIALDLEEIRGLHIVSGSDEPGCLICEQSVFLPCDAIRLCDEIDRLRAEVKRWQRIRTPTHGNCCTCQSCGLAHEDCRCDLDEVVDEVQRLRAENERLRGAMRQIAEEGAPINTATKDGLVDAYLWYIQTARAALAEKVDGS